MFVATCWLPNIRRPPRYLDFRLLSPRRLTLMGNCLHPRNIATELAQVAGSIELFRRRLQPQAKEFLLRLSQLGLELFIAHFPQFFRR